MKIVFSTDWYSEGMGYVENVLPAVLARRGHDVYVLSSTMQVYGDHDFYPDVYESYLGPAIVDPDQKVIDGVTVIRLPISFWWRRFRVVKARTRVIRGLRPDIVFTFDPRSYQTLVLSALAARVDYRLFTAVHTVGSVYPAYYNYASMPLLSKAYLRLTDTFVGWLASRNVHTCYAPTPDAGDIAVRFFGMDALKVKPLPQGVDLQKFHPLKTPADVAGRRQLRMALGVQADEVLCVYSGRFTPGKNPLCLAEAVAALRRSGRPYRALFLGEGEQGAAINSHDGCAVKSFVPYSEIASYYRAADIGVWPRQESISMIDAAACGLPIVASNRMKAQSRIEGNGLMYEEDVPADLAAVLEKLFDANLRGRLGEAGARKMADWFDIERTADLVLADFERALRQ